MALNVLLILWQQPLYARQPIYAVFTPEHLLRLTFTEVKLLNLGIFVQCLYWLKSLVAASTNCQVIAFYSKILQNNSAGCLYTGYKFEQLMSSVIELITEQNVCFNCLWTTHDDGTSHKGLGN